MFVRWQHRKRNSAKYGPTWEETSETFANGMPKRVKVGDTHWAAVLIESYRDNGKPRQRHVAYLGGIVETQLRDECKCQRGWFWEGIKEKLDRLDNRIAPDERAKIEAQIAAKVPPLSEPEFEECKRGGAQFRAQFQSLMGAPDVTDEKRKAQQRRALAKRTAEICGKCGGSIGKDAPVWRRRMYEGKGLFGGSRHTVVPVCGECVTADYLGDHTKSCEGCGRPVSIPSNIRSRLRYWYCSEVCRDLAYKNRRIA